MKWVVLWLSGIAIGFCLSLYFSSLSCGSWLKPNPEIRVVERIVQHTEYISVPSTLPEYEKCFRSGINIDLKFPRPDLALVTARDNCKKAEAEFKIEVTQVGGWKLYACLGVAAAGFLYGIIK